MSNENIKNFDDLVFENRNKQYGAYALRRSYSDNVNKAVVISLASSGVILLLFFMFSTKKESAITDLVIDPPTKWDNIAPQIIPVTPPKELISAHSVGNDLIPVVTTVQVIEKPVTTTTVVSSDGAVSVDEIPAAGKVNVSVEGPIVDVVPVKPPTILNHAAVMPQYVGGLKQMAKFIQKNFHYPTIAKHLNVEGTVVVSFVVDIEGNVIQVKVEKGISKECDEEAKHIVSLMPQWIAGKQNNIPVSVRQYLPIKFKLDSY